MTLIAVRLSSEDLVRAWGESRGYKVSCLAGLSQVESVSAPSVPWSRYQGRAFFSHPESWAFSATLPD